MSMERMAAAGQWFILVFSSLLLGFIFQYYNVPAALLLGPMIVGVVMGLLGATVRIHSLMFKIAQGVLGCMIAQTLSPAILPPLLHDWLLVLAVLICTLLASGLSGWLLVKFSDLPGSTGAWGSSPGGASAMVAMAGDFGADVRLVAFMQYLRVLLVATAAAFVARISIGNPLSTAVAIDWFPSPQWGLLATIVLALSGVWLAPKLRIPSGALLIPAVVGAALHSTGTLVMPVPEWLLATAYTFIGWTVGLRFTRPIFKLALRTLPQMVASIIGLMLICGGMAWALTRLIDVDMLTAYLATSPGGLDTVAIIAAGSHHVDLSFIMAMQTLRLLTIIVSGPAMARFISRRAEPSPS